MKAAHLDILLAARAAKRAVVLLTDIGSGESAILVDGQVAEAGKDGAGLAVDAALGAMADAALARGESRLVEVEGRRIFLQVLNPPLRLAVIGAGHIAQYLCQAARMIGFEVTVIDPRTSYASESRFPGVSLCHDWPDVALEAFAPDRRSAVVALSHDPKLDEPALAAALASDAFYIGALGSRKTQAQRHERMKAQGVEASQLARIHGPVGLDIGALSPAEIAIAITAQMIDVLRPEKKGLRRG